jgi:chromosome segregation ATPase
MSKLQEHIASIEGKLGLLLSKLKSLKKENDRLKRELEDKTRECEDQKKKAEQLSLQLGLSANNDNETLRSNKAALEKRINDYIKEIDKCIAVLGDQD